MGTAARHLLNGLSLGSILFLIAAGLSLAFGVLGILNLAHGAFFMVGAYVGWSMVVEWGAPWLLAVAAGGVAAMAVGVAAERLFLRRLHGRLDDQALLTLGLVMVITNGTQWVWDPIPKASFGTPAFQGSITFAGITYPIARFVIIGTAVIVLAVLFWVDKKTRLGARVRAGRDDSETLQALGVNFDHLSLLLFGFGAFLAGIGGVVGGQVLGANTQMALSTLLLAVVVVVVGGVGSVFGSYVGAVVIGVADTLGRGYFPEYASFTVYVLMILVLVTRPQGLMTGRA